MAKPGRKALLDPPVRWELSLPSSLAAQVEVLLADPVRGKTSYGARTKLITRLLREWLREQGATPDKELEEDSL